MEYDGNKVKRIDTVVISTQHSEDIERKTLTKDIIEYVVNPLFPRSFGPLRPRY